MTDVTRPAADLSAAIASLADALRWRSFKPSVVHEPGYTRHVLFPIIEGTWDEPYEHARAAAEAASSTPILDLLDRIVFGGGAGDGRYIDGADGPDVRWSTHCPASLPDELDFALQDHAAEEPSASRQPADRTTPEPDRCWYPAKSYDTATGGGLNADLLRKAAERGRVVSKKSDPNNARSHNLYSLPSVRDAYPAYQSRLETLEQGGHGVTDRDKA